MRFKGATIGFGLGGVVALAALAGGPSVQAQGRWAWDAGGPGDVRAYVLHGPGVPVLIPELRDTRRGQAWVWRNFADRTGFLTPRAAREADRAFLEIAGPDRARFDWDHPHRFAAPPPPPAAEPGGWDRAGMRAYHFRQNRYGAVFNLEDVLFETGSAALRPGAQARLRPLAGFLRGHPRQRLRIDGYTDSVGSQASNLVLSRDRARSVARALNAMGVPADRMAMDGHGEGSPVATNDTAAGRQLNRRVEVTLLGARAAEFG